MKKKKEYYVQAKGWMYGSKSREKGVEDLRRERCEKKEKGAKRGALLLRSCIKES